MFRRIASCLPQRSPALYCAAKCAPPPLFPRNVVKSSFSVRFGQPSRSGVKLCSTVCHPSSEVNSARRPSRKLLPHAASSPMSAVSDLVWKNSLHLQTDYIRDCISNPQKEDMSANISSFIFPLLQILTTIFLYAIFYRCACTPFSDAQAFLIHNSLRRILQNGRNKTSKTSGK